MQSFSSAKESISGGLKSTFESIFNALKIPYLVKSFDENVIYILMVLIIMIGLLVYMQIKNGDALDKNGKKGQIIKEVEIKKVREGFENGGHYEQEEVIVLGGEDEHQHENFEENQENQENDPMYIMDLHEKKNKKRTDKIEGFCNSTINNATTKLELEKKCNDIVDKEGCIALDCCSWTNYTNINNKKESKCKSSDKGQLIFKLHNEDVNDKIEDIDCVYYKNNKKGTGSKCS